MADPDASKKAHARKAKPSQTLKPKAPSAPRGLSATAIKRKSLGAAARNGDDKHTED